MDSARQLLLSTVLYVFPDDCFDAFFVRYEFFDQDCQRKVLSRLLGLAVSAGGALVMLPQIVAIYRARSAAGVSLAAVLLNLFACVSVASYSYEKRFVFSQWGDAFFMCVQLTVIVLQMLHHAHTARHMVVFLSVVASLAVAVQQHAVPMHVLLAMQSATIPLAVASKSLQLHANYSAQSTGNLSLVSVSLQFVGCLARVFTSVQETGDRLVVLSYVVGAVMNGLIVAQILAYARRGHHRVERKRRFDKLN